MNNTDTAGRRDEAPAPPESASADGRANGPSAKLFWGLALSVLLIDIVTKALAVKHLTQYYPKRIFGNVVRFTLAYNPGAAFSMSLGHPTVSRVVFGTFAAIALVILWKLYRGSATHDRLRVTAVALAWGGAAGNLYDRITSTRGVVDFIDVGINNVRFWTFNVADSAVSIGAVLLAVVLWREDAEIKRKQEADERERDESASASAASPARPASPVGVPGAPGAAGAAGGSPPMNSARDGGG